MDDYLWERTSESWKDLIPRRNFNELDINDETKIEHYERLKERFGIPLEVIEQWIYPLYYDANSTNNYGWLDYDNIEFSQVELDYSILSKLNVIFEYRNHVFEGAGYIAYDELPCTVDDKKYWKKESTWRVPPVILDVESLKQLQIPSYAEIQGSYQLIEGHSRLGYLLAAKNCGLLKRDNHKIYIMSYRG